MLSHLTTVTPTSRGEGSCRSEVEIPVKTVRIQEIQIISKAQFCPVCYRTVSHILLLVPATLSPSHRIREGTVWSISLTHHINQLHADPRSTQATLPDISPYPHFLGEANALSATQPEKHSKADPATATHPYPQEMLHLTPHEDLRGE